MIEQTIRFSVVAGVSAVLVLFGFGISAVSAAPKAAAFTNQGFIDAAHDNCAVRQGRTPKSCDCERKLISGDRMSDDDKEMAYYFWVDKEEYGKRFEAKKKSDPDWQPGFAQRFNNLQALVISACGR